MNHEVRIYDVAEGAMDDFLAAFRGVVALREQFDFSIVGGWVIPKSNRFVWVVRYDGEGDFEDAVRRYVSSPERRALDPDPAQYIVKMDTDMAHPFL
jgi:hypothetical protein